MDVDVHMSHLGKSGVSIGRQVCIKELAVCCSGDGCGSVICCSPLDSMGHQGLCCRKAPHSLSRLSILCQALPCTLGQSQ